MLNIVIHLFFFFSPLQDDVPYKPDEEFSIKFEFGFVKRNDIKEDFEMAQNSPYNAGKNDSSPLPHLKAIVEILKKDSLEVKLKIIRDNSVSVTKRKIELGEKVIIFSGFADDIKDQVSGYQHTVYFLNKEGDKVKKIVIDFDEEGFYYVNGKKKGKI